MKYIVLEGADGTGKTTLAKNLAEQIGAVFRFEPDSTTEVTKKLREFCLDKNHNNIVNANAREFMMLANRAISTQEVKNTIDSGISVVQDRSFLSGMVYAKVASKISFPDWWNLGKRALSIKPDIIVYVRTNNQNINKVDNDIYDHESNEFHTKIKETFDDAIAFVQMIGMTVITYENNFNWTPTQNAVYLKNLLKDFN